MTVQGAGVVPGSDAAANATASANANANAGAAQQTQLSPEQVETLLSAAETQDKIVEALNALAQRFEATQRGAPAKAAASVSDSAKDEVAALLEDPKSVIAKHAGEVVKQVLNTQLGPHLVARATADREANLANEQQRIDELYGEGFFAAQVRPLLVGKDGKSGALAAMSLADQALPENVASATDGILGTLLARQPKIITDALATQAQKRQARERTLNPPKTLGPGIPAGTPPDQIEIPDNVRESLRNFQRLGIPFGEKDLLAAVSRGRSLDDWKDAFKPPGKAA